MIKRFLLLAVVLLLNQTVARGQEWANKMFTARSHEFGSVAKASKQEFAFQFKNLYEEEVHVASVRSSCGCTTATISKDTLQTFETGEIIATYNTRSFDGNKSATITVTFDKPFYAEVQLEVSGYIRRDVVFNPGQVSFGTVDEGSPAEVKVDVAYAGRGDWEITDVRSANRHLEVELAETLREDGRVNYEMLVRLKPDAPVGYIQDQLTILTDDSSDKGFTLPVEGNVQPSLAVNPAQLFLGVIKPGETVTKKLVVRGKSPFVVTDVECTDESFDFTKPGDKPNTLQFVTVQFTAGEKAGSVTQKIVIKTDHNGGASATCTATATIAK